MRLYCVSRYRSSAGAFTEGQEIDVTDEVAEFLLRDSPGSFATSPSNAVVTKAAVSGVVGNVRPARGGRARAVAAKTSVPTAEGDDGGGAAAQHSGVDSSGEDDEPESHPGGEGAAAVAESVAAESQRPPLKVHG